jgi:hypothetical protein
VFTFAAAPPPVVTPPPVIVVPPPVVTPPAPPTNPMPPQDSGYQLSAKIDALAQQLAAHEAEDKAFRDETSRIYKGTLKFLVERVAPVVGGILATWQMSK